MTINLGTGADTLILSSAGANTLTVSSVETLTGGSQIDKITLGAAQVGAVVDLGAGADTLTLFNGTNSATVSNAETITGGNWTMPIERVTEATTRSITRNGRKSTAPIWKPVLSSERM